VIPLSCYSSALDRISPYIHETPLTYDPELKIFIKWENHQTTGSFKLRGALNKILSSGKRDLDRGIVAASAGNHGLGVAYSCKSKNLPSIIFCPESAVPKKIENIRKLGAEVRLVKGGYANTEKKGLDFASETRALWISPYNDELIICGQGTLALEMISQEPGLENATWLIPVGGGGLISGIAGCLKEKFNNLQLNIVGAQSEASPFMNDIFKTDTQDNVVEFPSIADGLAGAVEEGSITIPMVKKYVDDTILVSEETIKKAIAYAWWKYGEIIEGSGAVALAAVLGGYLRNYPAVILITGGNIQPEIHENIVNQYIGQRVQN
jgi:threonine dehydratase